MLVIKGEFETYAAVEQLQSCLLGEVLLGIGMFTGNVVAIKSIRPDVKTDLPETPLAEVCFSPYLRGNPLFVQVIEVVNQNGFHYVISEYVNGDDLLELLKQYPGGIDESIVSVIVRLICDAILACHDRGIALQDFSLENCLLHIKDTEGACGIKLCDPGQACLFRDRVSPRVKHCGMVGKRFRPPEIFETTESYDPTLVDSWCLGWSVWYLLFATPIFEVVSPPGDLDSEAQCDEADKRFLLFRSGNIQELMRLSGIDSKQCSIEAIDFILKLMTIDPTERMTIGQAILHPFIQKTVTMPLTLYTLPLPLEEVEATGKMRTTLRMLTMSQGLERYRLFRFLLYQYKELADCFKKVWAHELAAREQRDALRQSHSSNRRRSKKYDTLGCPMAQGEAKALRVTEKLKKYAPYTPKFYREEMIPKLCAPNKPSSTLVRSPVGLATASSMTTATTEPQLLESTSAAHAPRVRTLPSMLPSSSKYSATILTSTASPTSKNSMKEATTHPKVTPNQQNLLTTFINPVYKQHSFLNVETGGISSLIDCGASSRSTPRLAKRGGSNNRVIDGAVAARREIHTVATTSLLQHDAINGSKATNEASKSPSGRMVGGGLTKFNPAIAQRPLMTQSSLSQEVHSRISAAGRFLDVDDSNRARMPIPDTHTVSGDKSSSRPFFVTKNISTTQPIPTTVMTRMQHSNQVAAFLTSSAPCVGKKQSRQPTPTTLNAARHSLSSDWVGSAQTTKCVSSSAWPQSGFSDLTSWHQRGPAIKH